MNFSKKDWSRMTINLPEEEYREVRRVAGAAGISMSVFVRMIIQRALEIVAQEEEESLDDDS